MLGVQRGIQWVPRQLGRRGGSCEVRGHDVAGGVETMGIGGLGAVIVWVCVMR